MKKTRRSFSSVEKAVIVKRHLVEEVPVSALCNVPFTPEDEDEHLFVFLIRDNSSAASCCLLAGGGMRTDQVIGSTNRLGEHPEDRPEHYREVFATLYHNMGINARQTTLTDHRGRPHYLVDDRRPIRELI